MDFKQISYIQSKIVDASFAGEVTLEEMNDTAYNMYFNHLIYSSVFENLSKISSYLIKHCIYFYVSSHDDRLFIHFYTVYV